MKSGRAFLLTLHRHGFLRNNRHGFLRNNRQVSTSYFNKCCQLATSKRERFPFTSEQNFY